MFQDFDFAGDREDSKSPSGKSYVSSEVEHLFPQVGCARSKHQCLTVLRNQRLFHGMPVCEGTVSLAPHLWDVVIEVLIALNNVPPKKPPRKMSCRSDFTSTATHFVLFQSYLRQCCLSKHVSSFSHAVDSGTGVRRTAWALADFLRFWITVRTRERCFWSETWTVEICTALLANVLGQGGRCSVSGQKHFHPKASTSRSEFFFALHVTTPALRVYLWRLLVILTMNARRFQRTHPLSGMGSSLARQRVLLWEVRTWRISVDQNQWWARRMLRGLAQLVLVLHSTQILVTWSDIAMYTTVSL